MLLQEFIYFEKDQAGMKNNDRYDPNHDTSVITDKDNRKSRLRKAGDAREVETREDLELVRIMYAIPAEPTE
jgi:hypothetical protein